MPEHADRALGHTRMTVAYGYDPVVIHADHRCVKLSVRRTTGRLDKLAEVKWDPVSFDSLAVIPWPPVHGGYPAYMVVRNGKEWLTVVDYYRPPPSLFDRLRGALDPWIRLGRSMLLPMGGQG